jgi:hypothetical protein
VSVLTRSRKKHHVANSVIADPEDHTTIDSGGAVRSIQAANVDMPVDDLAKIWSGADLERLARTYWWYLSRISLGLIRVHYSDTERAVVFLTRPFVLLRFHPPEYTLTENRGIVRWRIRDGILVAQRDDGYLEIDVRRMPSEHEGYERAHVAHPRGRHPRVPQAARAHGARGVSDRALRGGAARARARGRHYRLHAVDGHRRPGRGVRGARRADQLGVAPRVVLRPWRCRSARAAWTGRGVSRSAAQFLTATA